MSFLISNQSKLIQGFISPAIAETYKSNWKTQNASHYKILRVKGVQAKSCTKKGNEYEIRCSVTKVF
jgi:hypothetical protein